MTETRSDLVRRSDGLQFRSVDRAKRTARFVASSDTIDSHGEIVEQDWDLSRYRKNPVILYGHDRWGLPIGRAVECGLVDGNLEVEILFAPATANPFAEQVWQLVDGEFLRAVSVGFLPGDARRELRDGVEVWVLRQNVLFEISVVPIGSNPDALGKEPEALTRMKAAFIAAQAATPATEEKAMADTAKDPTPVEVRVTVDDTIKKSLDDARGEIETLKRSAVEKDAKIVELTAKNAELTKQNGDLAAAQTRGEIEAFVGKKILPAELDSLVKWALTDKDACLANIKARGDLTLTTPIVTGGEADKAKGAPSTNGAELGARLAS